MESQKKTRICASEGCKKIIPIRRLRCKLHASEVVKDCATTYRHKHKKTDPDYHKKYLRKWRAKKEKQENETHNNNG